MFALLQFYFLLSVISIVETILDLLSPSRGGISAVPIAIALTLSSFTNRFLVISATSTAVVMAWPRAFRVISCSYDCQNIAHGRFVSDEDYVISFFSHFLLLLFLLLLCVTLLLRSVLQQNVTVSVVSCFFLISPLKNQP
jgi:hypothetical protein